MPVEAGMKVRYAVGVGVVHGGCKYRPPSLHAVHGGGRAA
jgi:hypothetical protein